MTEPLEQIQNSIQLWFHLHTDYGLDLTASESLDLAKCFLEVHGPLAASNIDALDRLCTDQLEEMIGQFMRNVR